ncbi:MAG: hypothetical protein A3I01_04600 [Betaproteobacteria bacterium RIFCSPLOWO2_02_FULL_65_24]|nr:MAG: hypothetical protein A3I01_04600 [Betaproteobacteria bacterium RIFCSPLOWO2_02_FULL_65_24]OGA95380.1 MAG: hypothetical protein A3G27_03290 [Betaproteobacteria bacterium RIFCSPLOWO2_12_FULL_66_14]
MLRIFATKPDHPMADLKEARKILEEIPAGDPQRALDELGHWLESVGTAEGFRPEQRAQLLLLIDESAQPHLRKLTRDYLSSQRLSKFQESRLWTALHGYWHYAATAFGSMVNFYGSGEKGADALKNLIALVTVRALRSVAQQMKWQYLRYGPFDDSLWGLVAKVYALAEARKCAQTMVTVYPAVPGESSAEQEFLRAVMLAASSPDSLLPMEIELAERLIAHFCASFKLVLEQQPDIAYWIDLATSQPPLRLARPPHHAPTLRFFAAGHALQELEELTQKVKASNAVPSAVNLGGSYDPAMVLDVLHHLSLYWSSKPPERKHPRHRVKTRLAVTHGMDGVLAALGAPTSLDFDMNAVESWIVDNVSAGGFGVVVPQIKGEWLKIGCLLGLQPEGGDNWVLGVVRRFNRDSPQQGSVGIQTLARAMQPVQLRVEGASIGKSLDTEPGILLDLQNLQGALEAYVIVRPGVLSPGLNLEFESGALSVLLLPQEVTERAEDYEVVRCRPMLRDTGE